MFSLVAFTVCDWVCVLYLIEFDWWPYLSVIICLLECDASWKLWILLRPIELEWGWSASCGCWRNRYALLYMVLPDVGYVVMLALQYWLQFLLLFPCLEKQTTFRDQNWPVPLKLAILGLFRVFQPLHTPE